VEFHQQGDPAFSISLLAGRRLIGNRLEEYQSSVEGIVLRNRPAGIFLFFGYGKKIFVGFGLARAAVTLAFVLQNH
jgi:hypothetical protein